MHFHYKYSVVGGTFDHFHKGHKKLLDTAFAQSENVTVGISTEKLYNNKILSNFIENYVTREVSINKYLIKDKLESRSEIVSIDDIYGTTLGQKEIDAIFVTEENIRAAELINERRSEIGFVPLKIIKVPFINADDGQPISSERIRKGAIDRNGLVYKSLFENTTLYLPASLRTQLRKPIGPVIQDIHSLLPQLADAPMVISVGDIVTFSLAEAGNQADLSIIDFKTRRHELQEHERALLNTLTVSAVVCSNQAGKISSAAAECIYTMIDTFLQTKQKLTLRVTGEEDLLTLPAILFAPLGSLVIYGQYGEGAVIVTVTEEKKREIHDLINHFTQE